MTACAKCGLLHGAERRCYYDVIIEALDGIPLTDRDHRYIRWLAGFDNDAVDGFLRIVSAARKAGIDDRRKA